MASYDVVFLGTLGAVSCSRRGRLGGKNSCERYFLAAMTRAHTLTPRTYTRFGCTPTLMHNNSHIAATATHKCIQLWGDRLNELLKLLNKKNTTT